MRTWKTILIPRCKESNFTFKRKVLDSNGSVSLKLMQNVLGLIQFSKLLRVRCKSVILNAKVRVYNSFFMYPFA